MDVIIEKNVPIKKAKMGRKVKYPFAKMKVNESFFVEGGTYSSLYSCAKNFSDGTSKQFRVMTEGEGVRVWRIK